MMILMAGLSTTGGGGEERPYLEAAMAAARWLRSVEFASDHGLAWPVAPDDSDRTAADLYYGSSGVVLFFLEMARSSGDPGYLVDARRGADHLLATLSEELDRQETGLYTGIAGLGFVLTEVGRATAERSYREGAGRCLRWLLGAARRAGAGVEWSPLTDIIDGSAGTGLFLLYAARELEDPASLRLATAAGRRLIELARPAENGITWRADPESPNLLPNFSHGTAGVGYLLASLYLETRDRSFLEAALNAARQLTAAAHTASGGCLIPHHLPGGEQLHYLSWCHGPAGTARLFYRLHQATGDSNWLEWLDRCVRTIAQSGIPERSTPGFWNNVGQCCGSAGVADFLLSLERVQGERRHRPLAERLARNILDRASRTEDGLKWIHAEHRVKPDLLLAQTGLMQGAAGIGRLLLRLDAVERGRDRTIPLPDSPF